MKIKKKSQSGPKNKIDAKNSKNNLITLYSFMFLYKNGTFWRWPFSPFFTWNHPNAKHRFCRHIPSLFRTVRWRAVIKLIYGLLYSNFTAFKIKRACQIYENKTTCKINIFFFFFRSEQKVLFLCSRGWGSTVISHNCSVDLGTKASYAPSS